MKDDLAQELHRRYDDARTAVAICQAVARGDVFRAAADLVGTPVDRLLQAELERMVDEEAGGVGAQSLIAACLQQRVSSGSDSQGRAARFKGLGR